MSNWKEPQAHMTVRNKQEENKSEVTKHNSTIEKLKKMVQGLQDRIKNLDEEVKQAHRADHEEIQAKLKRIKLLEERVDNENAESAKIRERAEQILKDNIDVMQDVNEYQAKSDVIKHQALGEIKRENEKIKERQKEQDEIARKQISVSQLLSQRDFGVSKREASVNAKEIENDSTSRDLDAKESVMSGSTARAADAMTEAIAKTNAAEKLMREARTARAKAVESQMKSDVDLANARTIEAKNLVQSKQLAETAREQRYQADYLRNWETVNKKEAQKYRRVADMKKKAK